MKALTCEMCGSTEIVRKDGLYVCQACGTKYSVEDAKKMMMEGTIKIDGPVKIDDSENLANLKTLAERATKNQDWDRAYRYYEQILYLQPNDWEANHNVTFFRTFLANQQNLFPELSSRLQVFQNSISSLNDLLSEKYSDNEIQNEMIQAWNPVFVNCETLWNDNVSRMAQNISFTTNEAKQQMMQQNMQIIMANLTAIVDFMFALTYDIQKKFGNSSQSWFLTYAKKAADFGTRTKDYPKPKVDEMVSFIKGFEPNYNAPTKPGCYIATAVYGSYDCPEVWTLRRFRDFTLNETWYGRAFIKSYYVISPTLVKLFGKSQLFKAVCILPLNKLVNNLHRKGVEDTPYIDKY